MSAAAAVLPMVWAYAEPVRVTERKGPQRVGEATTLAVAAAGLRSLAVVGGGATRQEVSQWRSEG